MKVLIAKLGFCTRLYQDCNNTQLSLGMFDDLAECYTFETLLSERTGDEHNEIVIVAGSHMIEKTQGGRYTVWYLNDEAAEPYTTYRDLDQAMDRLKEVEQFTFA
jgi:hypothetical protein